MIDFRQSKYWANASESWLQKVFSTTLTNCTSRFSFAARVQSARMIFSVECEKMIHKVPTRHVYGDRTRVEGESIEISHYRRWGKNGIESRSEHWTGWMEKPFLAMHRCCCSTVIWGSSCYERHLNLSRCPFSALHYVNPSCTFTTSCNVSRAPAVRFFWPALRGTTMLQHRFDDFFIICEFCDGPERWWW